jgi:hypothetical protein
MAQQLVVEYGIGRKANRFFDLFDCDEGRDPAAERPWLRDAVRELSVGETSARSDFLLHSQH